MTQNRIRRVMVVGLDGATWDLARSWAQQGYLPTFNRLMNEGAWGDLRSTVPPITAPAWSSFITGKNPGKHGLYDFGRRAANGYEMRLSNAASRHGDSLWKLLGKAGKRVGMLNVPATFPPEPVNGFMVSGLMTPPGTANFTYPAELGDELKAALGGYEVLPPEVLHPRGREEGYLEILRRMTQERMRATRYLTEKQDWDFFMVVFMALDNIQHALWKYHDPTHPDHDPSSSDALKTAIRDCYVVIDAHLNELLTNLDDDTLLVLMSDHGAGPLERYIHLNTWLLNKGYLRLKADLPTRGKSALYRFGFTPVGFYNMLLRVGLGRGVSQALGRQKSLALRALRAAFLSFADVDWSKTRAYSLGNVGPVYINLKGREPQGMVEPGAEYEALVAELSQELMEMKDPRNGQSIMERVYHRDELFWGDQTDNAPDLIFITRDLRYITYGEYEFPGRSWFAPTFDRSGGHRMNGMLLLRGPGVRQGMKLDGAAIADLAPTILAAMGVPVPEDMDGRVLTDAFEEGALSDVGMQEVVQSDQSGEEETDVFSEEEEEQVKERLRGLGYLS